MAREASEVPHVLPYRFLVLLEGSRAAQDTRTYPFFAPRSPTSW